MTAFFNGLSQGNGLLSAAELINNPLFGDYLLITPVRKFVTDIYVICLICGNPRSCSRTKLSWSSWPSETEHGSTRSEITKLRGDAQTWGLAGASVRLQSVSGLTMTSEGASLVETVLTADAQRMAFIHVLTRLRVVAQLVAHGTGALGSKRALDAAVSAARVVVRAALLIYDRAEKSRWIPMWSISYAWRHKVLWEHGKDNH